MSDKSSREESFSHLLSREKELPQPEGTENQAISGVPYLQVSERDVVAAEKPLP